MAFFVRGLEVARCVERGGRCVKRGGGAQKSGCEVRRDGESGTRVRSRLPQKNESISI